MNIRYDELCSTDFTFTDLFAYRMTGTSEFFCSYEQTARTKHLVYCQLENCRVYYSGEKHICTMAPGDVLFLPHGCHYHSFVEDTSRPSNSIGVSFYLWNVDGEPIFFDEGIRVFRADDLAKRKKRFERIMYAVMNPANNAMRIKVELFSLLDELFGKRENVYDPFEDIATAVRQIENHPEENQTVHQLASLCLMSESSFVRKFKEYSGGVSPIEYRNRVRLMMAEEMASTTLTVGEIADKLGFYDASHLCKLYKKTKGHSLKQKIIQ